MPFVTSREMPFAVHCYDRQKAKKAKKGERMQCILLSVAQQLSLFEAFPAGEQRREESQKTGELASRLSLLCMMPFLGEQAPHLSNCLHYQQLAPSLFVTIHGHGSKHALAQSEHGQNLKASAGAEQVERMGESCKEIRRTGGKA
eukprot:1162134-Pelagomonas_calceolata.AAC.13